MEAKILLSLTLIIGFFVERRMIIDKYSLLGFILFLAALLLQLILNIKSSKDEKYRNNKLQFIVLSLVLLGLIVHKIVNPSLDK